MSKCLIANISTEIMNSLDFEYACLGDKDLPCIMNDLLKKETQEPEPIFFKEPFIFLSEMSEEEISKVTQTLKNHQIKAITIVSTPTNLTWTFSSLYEEVMEEHAYFQTMDELKALLKEKMQHIESGKEEILMASFMALQSGDAKEMKKAIEILKKLN